MDYGPNKSQVGTGTTVSLGSIDRHLDALLTDGPDIIQRLTRIGGANGPAIEIKAELPARVDCDIIIAMVNRWSDISFYYNKPVRVYGWCYNDKVEDYMQSLVCHRENVHLTVLPPYLMEVKKYA